MSLLPRRLLLAIPLLFVLPSSAGLGQQATEFSTVPTKLATPPGLPRPEDFLNRGVVFEQQRLWQQAADLYERGVRHYPNDDLLKTRLSKAERLYSFSRRFNDTSYVRELLRLSEFQAAELLREILGKIQSHYVEPVSIPALLQRGYTNIAFAIGDPEPRSHWARVLPTGATRQAEVDLLIAELRLRSTRLSVHAERNQSAAMQLTDAVDEARAAGRLVQERGFGTATAVIMEFVSAISEGLDPYSCHLSPNRMKDLYAMIDGNFVGLGVEVRGTAKGLEIVHVIPESPAEECGLKAGDILTAVDGRDLSNMGAEAAANLLQGRADSQVVMLVDHPNQQTRQVTATRREVVVHSVTRAEIIDPAASVGYIRLESFQKLTVEELEEAYRRLQALGMRSLILDVRGNPGGLLDVGLTVVNHFVEQGVLVSTQGRAWGQSWSHRAREMDVWTLPIAVLIDGESASASEILAGAIKDHRRGVIVGTRSYGKGSVQSIFPLRSANTALRLTTAHFYSPQGKVYQGVGVEPDIRVSRPLGNLGEELPISPVPTLLNDNQIKAACVALAP